MGRLRKNALEPSWMLASIAATPFIGSKTIYAEPGIEIGNGTSSNTATKPGPIIRAGVELTGNVSFSLSANSQGVFTRECRLNSVSCQSRTARNSAIYEGYRIMRTRFTRVDGKPRLLLDANPLKSSGESKETIHRDLGL